MQLNVDVATAGGFGGFGEVAFRWLDELSMAVAGDARDSLKGLPARVVTRPREEPWDPLGEPGELWGIVTVTRGGVTAPAKTAERNCSAAGFRWLRKQLEDPPTRITLEIGHLDDMGHRSGRSVFLTAKHSVHSPGWLVLQARDREHRFLDPAHGPEVQRGWLAALRSWADQLNPGYGQIAYARGFATALEDSLPPAQYPPQHRTPEYTLNDCRQMLRGYSWLTILPAELVKPAGGPDRLRDCGAFAAVDPLPGGGLWLLATEDFRDYNADAVERVFRALAPVLRPGRPVPKPAVPPPLVDNSPPQLLVFEDAATAGG